MYANNTNIRMDNVPQDRTNKSEKDEKFNSVLLVELQGSIFAMTSYKKRNCS